MDHIDRCIVDILQHNARLPVKEIASRVSLSSPAVCARIERLEKSGVLASYQAMINVTTIGYLVKAFINLEVEPEQKPAFYPYIESCTNVVECSCVTGEYSSLGFFTYCIAQPEFSIAFFITLSVGSFI